MQKDKKSILINSELYDKLKSYCKDNGYVIKSIVEKIISYELSKNIQSNLRKSKD